MKKGEVLRRMLLVSIAMLFMTACSHNEPKVKQQEKVNSKIKEEEKILELTKLSSSEAWVPLKIEDEIEWNAKELLGLKYVWGATGPTNYDCSGFTQKIYRDLGINLPRVSRDQAEHGELVSFENLKKGDLVFFDTNRKKPGQVTHVGIYIGDNNFIHASSSAKKIVICNFEKDCFYKKQFLWARRVVQPKQYVASKDEEKSLKSAI
ncbi:C40 family peptidase [bacterium]|nr:C40 family peptidase [bacterium]MBU1958134.1 C40 family peptidase [bacterium]